VDLWTNLRELVLLVALPFGLLLISIPLTYTLSQRLSRPIKILASQFQALFQQTPALVTIQDQQGKVLNSSEAFKRCRAEQERRGFSSEIFPPDLFNSSGQSRQIALKGEGKPKHLLASHFSIDLEPEQDSLRCVVAIDISQEVQARQERDYLAAAVEHTRDFILLMNPQQEIIYTNTAFIHQIKRFKEQILGSQLLSLLTGENQRDFKPFKTSADTHSSWRGRLEFALPEEESFLADLSLSPVRNHEGELSAFVLVGRNVTQQVEFEAQLIQAQKMEALGRLAGGIAHDFNNLLTVIYGASEMLSMEEGLNAEAQGLIQEVQAAGSRATELTRKLLAISRRQVLSPQILQLNEVIQELYPLLKRALSGAGEFQLRTWSEEKLWPICADQGQLEQVLMNLVINARDACGEKGKITIELNNHSLGREVFEGRARIAPGDYVMLSISDSGAGIPAEIREQIFDPFFTTKPVGRGTGLGLSTVQGIINQNGGQIWLFSEMGVGTSFRIALPRHRNRNSKKLTSPLPQISPGGRERILVVDDEKSIRKILSHILEVAGYEIFNAEDGQDALEQLELLSQENQLPQLILSDLIMPRMNGPELLEALHLQGLHLPFLFMSGYSADLLDLHPLVKQVPLLQKPLSTPELRDAVRQALDESQSFSWEE